MTYKNLQQTFVFCIIICSYFVAQSQKLMEVEGNGLFYSPASTNLDVRSTDDNTNSLIRFGDNDENKVSLGFNGNDDVFKISSGSTLGIDDFTMALDGKIGVNALPSNHRFFIKHNSTSGIGGSAHLALEETGLADFARLRFGNTGDDGLWALAARATEGSAIFNFFHNDGTNFANVMSLDGETFRVGIHETAPEAYLHIKQKEEGVDALILQNDDQTGSEIWSFQIGDEDLDLYFEGVIRGSFDSGSGAYTAIPPPAPNEKQMVVNEPILDQILQLTPVSTSRQNQSKKSLSLDPATVEKINPNWVVRSGDGAQVAIDNSQFSILAIKSVQEQQVLIQQQQEEIDRLESEEKSFTERLEAIEAKLTQMAAKKKSQF